MTYEEFLAEQERMCGASVTLGGADPYGASCELEAGHRGPHVSANPFGTSYQPSYRARPGGKPATSPGRASFWVASVAGRGSQALTWSVKQGRWAVVVMRPDGSRTLPS